MKGRRYRNINFCRKIPLVYIPVSDGEKTNVEPADQNLWNPNCLYPHNNPYHRDFKIMTDSPEKKRKSSSGNEAYRSTRARVRRSDMGDSTFVWVGPLFLKALHDPGLISLTARDHLVVRFGLPHLLHLRIVLVTRLLPLPLDRLTQAHNFRLRQAHSPLGRYKYFPPNSSRRIAFGDWRRNCLLRHYHVTLRSIVLKPCFQHGGL
jgi:hypothetical protein